MKAKFLKAIALCLALLMVASLAGCGGDKGEETNAVSNGSPVTLNGDKIYPISCDDTLTYWFSATAIWNQKYENFAETPIGQEVAKQTGVKVEYIHPAEGQGAEQFQLLLASDELPDMVNSEWFSFPGGPDEAIAQDYIYELTDIIDQYCPALSALYKDKVDWAKGNKTDAGNFYAFPNLRQEDPLLAVVIGPIVRTDWMKELNLKNPVTMDDWENVLTTFKEKKNVEIPFSGGLSNMTCVFYPAFGGYTGWYQDNGKVVYGEAQPQYKEFLAKMNDWYKKGLIDQDFFVTDNKNFQSDLLNDKVGAYYGYAGSGLGTYIDANKDNPSFDIGGVQYPVMKAGDANAEYSNLNPKISTGTTTAISKNCKNVELAARFLDFGFTELGHNVYNFGIEGESYNWVDKDGEKYPEYSDLVYKNPDGLTVSDVLHMYTRAAHGNVPFVTDVRHIVQFYPHKQQKDAQVEWAKTNMANHHLPPIYITPEESEDDSSIMVSVKTYVDEMSVKFITGEKSLDEFDEYLAQIEKFGLPTSAGFRQAALERANNR